MIDQEKASLDLTKRLLHIQSDIRHLHASVSVLKACVTILLMPDQTEEALEHLRELEEMILDADPTGPARKKAFAVIEALQALKKRGASGSDS
jgi:hypothetical protein